MRLLHLIALCTLLGSLLLPTPLRAQTEQPEFVGLPGTHQTELGCSGDWQPDCPQTALSFDEEDQLWQGSFLITSGNDQDQKGPRYKVALNGTWAENYGAYAQAGGADIPLLVSQPTEVKFYYDHRTNWITDNFNQPMVTAIGDFQLALGCSRAADPGCLRSWMQDPDGDGLYEFVTSDLPPGTYEVRAALNEGLDQTFGGPDGSVITFTVAPANAEIYMSFDMRSNQLNVNTSGRPRGSLTSARAHWVRQESFLWNVIGSPRYAYLLHASPTGDLQLNPDGISGGESFPLSWVKAGAGEDVFKQFPHLAGYTTLQLAATDRSRITELLRGQLALSAYDEQGKLVDATRIQIPGVLDDLYRYDGPLGVEFSAGSPTLRIWAPTARSVTLELFADSRSRVAERLPLSLDATTGVWSISGNADWKGKFYLYEVEVYVPATGQIERNLVTDPYAISLSTNSLRSQIVDLDDPALQPAGWADLAKPPLEAPEDSVIYELHIRDFSANDPSLPAERRGTYLAFTEGDSHGMRHLRALAEAGLTHLHLLPTFDIASINEDRATWQTVDPAVLAALPGDSEQQATLLQPLRDADGFNWGYDPFHYNVPEGSYASDPDGATRILEFRQMVQALNQSGLRVVLDVVYNHTNASGQSNRSVLDRVVPGYYHRLDADGQVERSTCCENTATEQRMMEKLMIDSLLLWAKAYKIDGFRFDLMGHHMLDNMLRVRQSLEQLRVEQDGVDGRAILLYGEGWDFGEVAQNARGRNASQLNLAGSGIASFNDRLRDGARGGGPFDPTQEQGFLTGLAIEPNAYQSASEPPNEQLRRLLDYSDWIRIGMAGGLKEYPLTNARGQTLPGERIDYRGAPAGYTLDPGEQIVYVSAHDNETIFDAIQWKAAASATISDRVRMNNLGVSLVLLSQGIPFFHAGDDLLRSKSLDGNSYNSGDWYNRLDFTYQQNNWAIGLPDYRTDQWESMRGLLANPQLVAGPADLEAARRHFLELLQLRRSSPLFRLRTAADVQARLHFFNTGPEQLPGLIGLQIADDVGDDLDPNYDRLVVLINTNPGPMRYDAADLRSLPLQLHPILAQSADPLVRQATFDSLNGRFEIPGRTAAVFVLPQLGPTPTAVVAAAEEETAQPTPAPFPWAILSALLLGVMLLAILIYRRSLKV